MYFRENESPYGNKRMLIQRVTVPKNNSPNQVRICRAKGGTSLSKSHYLLGTTQETTKESIDW